MRRTRPRAQASRPLGYLRRDARQHKHPQIQWCVAHVPRVRRRTVKEGLRLLNERRLVDRERRSGERSTLVQEHFVRRNHRRLGIQSKSLIVPARHWLARLLPARRWRPLLARRRLWPRAAHRVPSAATTKRRPIGENGRIKELRNRRKLAYKRHHSAGHFFDLAVREKLAGRGHL